MAQCAYDVIDGLFDDFSVVAFGHDADDGFGAGGADDEAAMGAEGGLGSGDGFDDALVLEGLAALVADVFEDLRQRIEQMADIADGALEFADHGQHLQGGDEAVARGGIIRQDHVAGLFAAEIVTVLAHMFEDVAIADGGAGQSEADAAEIALEAEIGHDGGDDARLGEAAIILPAFGDDGHELVAIDDLALFIDDDDAVGVAIERDADIGAHFADLADDGIGRGGADIAVDVEAVRLDANGEDFGAELPQSLGGDFVGGAIGAVDHDAEAVEIHGAGQCALGEFNVAGVDALDALGAAEGGGGGETVIQIAVNEGFDFVLGLVGELEAIGIEQLDAIILIGVVGGGNHDAEIGAHGARQHGDGGCRHRAEQQHIHADRGEAGDKGRLDHVAGEARILADDDAVAMLAAAEDEAGGLTDAKREIGRDHLVGFAANAIGAEIFTRHPTAPLPAHIAQIIQV